MSTQPLAALTASRACSTLMGSFVTNCTEMEWLRITGTRTQVQHTFRSGRCMILRPSFCIFISSVV